MNKKKTGIYVYSILCFLVKRSNFQNFFDKMTIISEIEHYLNHQLYIIIKNYHFLIHRVKFLIICNLSHYI